MKPKLAAGAIAVLMYAGQLGTGTAATNNTEPSSFDRQFLVKAIQTNNAEIREAVRMEKSKDANVRIFAEQMIKDHAAANAQLGAYGDQRNIPYPKSLIRKVGSGTALSSAPAADETDVTEHQTGSVAKAKVTKAVSPRAYMQKEVGDHETAISLYRDEARNGSDQQLKVLVGSLLPIVQAHLQMAKQYLAGQKMTMPAPVPAMNNVQAPSPSPKP